MPRPPPSLSIQLKGLSDREPMITGNDLFSAAKGPGRWHSSPKIYRPAEQRAGKLVRRVHKPDDCGRTHFLRIVVSEIGRNKDGKQKRKPHASFSAGAEESHFLSDL